jgi:hypothetical protein
MIALLLASVLGYIPPTVSFDSSRYGLHVDIPKAWELAQREDGDRIFVALIPQTDPLRPGVAACELGLAPETLDEYRTRLDQNAARDGRPGAKLVRNEVVKDADGERLETLREFRPRSGGVWCELSVRMVANRQMYTFLLNVSEPSYAAARRDFEALLATARFARPDTGADPAGPNRWAQREFKFALALPEGWAPVLAPSEVALLYANGPAHGIWSDNVLVLAHPHRPTDLAAMAKTFPDDLRRAEPGCEVLSCGVVKQGKLDALETVVRTRRGPFSMTILERRFRGERFDYEVKYTVESKRFDALAPAIRQSLDSFAELPGAVPKGGASRPA